MDKNFDNLMKELLSQKEHVKWEIDYHKEQMEIYIDKLKNINENINHLKKIQESNLLYIKLYS